MGLLLQQKKGLLRRCTKAQTSLFLLVGIVLLLMVGTFLFLQNLSQTPDIDVEGSTSNYAEVAVVQEFVSSCFDEVTKDALLLVGSQGGYTSLESVNAQTSYYGATEADAFLFGENSESSIPYWHYLLSPNECEADCLFYSQRPTLSGTQPRSVEEQMRLFFNEEFPQCINEYAAFTQQGYQVTELERTNELPFELNVLFRENDVKFILSYPIEVSQGQISDELDTFTIEHDVPFARMYTLASVLAAAEFEYKYLEANTMELISLNAGVDSQKLPPLGGSTTEYVSPVFWTVPDVENKLQEILTVYTNAFQVQGTKNYRPITFDSSLSQSALERAFANMVLPVSDPNNEFIDMDVRFEYLNWPWYFNINSNGAVIEPDSVSIDFFPWFGIQRYRHYYDISYPVRVVIHNEEAFNGNGYNFVFGLESNIRDNTPLRPDYERLERPFDIADEELDQSTILCQPTQRNTENITITVRDKHDGSLIPDAAITFTCGTESCPIGTTNENGQYFGALPICGGALLTALKQDSVKGNALVSTSIGYDEDIFIGMEPYVEKKLAVKRLLLVKGGWKFGRWTPANSFSDVAVDELVTIQLERLSEYELGSTDPLAFYEEPYQTAVIYPGDLAPNEDIFVNLVPGTYRVKIQSIQNQRVYIPESIRVKDDYVYTIPEVEMEQFPAGKLNLDETTQFWTVTAEDLRAGDTLLLKYIASDLPQVQESQRVVEDLDSMDKYIDKYVPELLDQLMPEVLNS